MHNWRLLLLAFVAVFQPIASFTESSGVDGRQRCDYRATSLLRDPGVHFHGTYPFTKPAVEDRRLNQREDVRRIRHDEVRGEFRTPLQSRIADAIEKSVRILPSLSRSSRSEYRLTRNAAVLSRKSRDERQSEIRRTRLSTFESRLSVLDDERQIPNTRSSARLPMERRQQSQRNQETQRARDVRDTLIAGDRVRGDATDFIRNTRRIARERIPRMDMRQSATKMLLERSASREMNRATEFRGSLMTGVRVNRANDNEDYRSIRKDISHSLDRDERRSTRSRRTLDNERLQRTRRSRDSIVRERVLDEQRMAPEFSARIRDLQSDLLVENRRDFSYREARLRGNRVVEAQRETRNNERDTRLAKAHFEENRVSRNSKRGSSTETRRGENIFRNMEREYRPTANRRNVRSQDRESQRNVRNTFKDSPAIRLDRERATEVRGEARYAHRQSRSLNNERNAERRNSERVNRLFTESDAQNQRNSRNLELQRDAGNERASREVRRESPLGRSIRINFGNTRSIENKRSQEVRRETRNGESRRITVEHENRRNNERLSQSFDRLVDSRRDTRENNRDARILRQKRSSETRDTERISRARDMSEENRRSVGSNERQSRNTGEERNLANRRAIRTAEITNSRLTRRESLAEKRSDIRKVDIETSRIARNTEKDFRSVRTKDTRGVRARDSLSMDRKSFRATERLSMRATPIKSRRSRSIEESRTVANNMDPERRAASSRFITEMARKREFLTATGKNENETSKMNWQYLFYALQGVYLCGILTQMMNEKRADMKTRTLSWWSAPQHLIKVD